MSEQLNLTFGAAAPSPEQLAALERHFPGAFAEGQLDVERLVTLLGHGALGSPDEVERYRFSWSGRQDCTTGLQRPPQGALRPMADASLDFEAAPHVIIEGDNLEVLKLLQAGYTGRIKAIVIDPPYNTGQDFIYPDNFSDGIEAYLKATGQLDEQGQRLSSKAEVDGRHHSRWLSMMLPRLMLARQLLTDDGAIFVAIDDHESHHLRMLMNEVFGEENFVAQIVWQKRYTRSNNTERFTSVIDHVLLYQKSEAFRPNLQPRTERDLVEFKNPDDDPRGPWKPTSFLNQVPPERRPNLTYPITNPNTGQVTENDRKAWRVNRETYERLLSEGRLWWGRDGARPIPQVKTYQSEVRQGLTPINFWSHQYAGHTDLAHAELKALFGRKVFDTPKPSLLIRRMLEHATGPEDYVLDFFAGSGSTAQAVMELNAEDGGARRYMLVQLPEPVSEGAFDTISAITRARARRVAERLASSTSDSSSHNGFRAFSLQPTQLPSWPSHDPPTDAEALLTQLHAQLEVGEQRSDGEALLFEVIPLVGLTLDVAYSRIDICGREVFEVSEGRLIFVPDTQAVTLDFIDELVRREPERVVFREASFDGDDGLMLAARQAAQRHAVVLHTV